jgi:hypothetical protein
MNIKNRMSHSKPILENGPWRDGGCHCPGRIARYEVGYQDGIISLETQTWAGIRRTVEFKKSDLAEVYQTADPIDWDHSCEINFIMRDAEQNKSFRFETDAEVDEFLVYFESCIQ